MNKHQWQAFNNFTASFKQQCNNWYKLSIDADIPSLQKQAALADGVPEYNIENPVVYSTALDEITPDSNIKLIIIGDNPGKNEQLNINREYLVGQAGKIADGFFKKHPELNIDFRTNAIILNKTPLHSAKTKELNWMLKNANPKQKDALQILLYQSQIWMAQNTALLHSELNKFASENGTCGLWLVGYSELKPKGLFIDYCNELGNFYKQKTVHESVLKNFLVFQHFSMNRFSIDLANHTNPSLSLIQNIYELGLLHRQEILNF